MVAGREQLKDQTLTFARDCIRLLAARVCQAVLSRYREVHRCSANAKLGLSWSRRLASLISWRRQALWPLPPRSRRSAALSPQRRFRLGSWGIPRRGSKTEPIKTSGTTLISASQAAAILLNRRIKRPPNLLAATPTKITKLPNKISNWEKQRTPAASGLMSR